jgi:hypothetical protein
MSGAEITALVKKNPISVGCAVLSLLLAGAIYYRSDAIALAEADLDEKSATAERFALNIKNGAQLKEQMDELAAANKEIDARLISGAQLGINQQIFYKLESETGVKLSDTPRQNSAGVKHGSFSAIVFSLSLQGEFPAVIDFLRQIESGGHYGHILSATCAGNSVNRGAPLSVTLTVEMLGRP